MTALRRGVTLIEILVVVAIIGLMASISFPSVVSGLEGIRLRSSADDVAAFFNAAMIRAERHQEPIEIVADPKQNRILMFGTQPSSTKTLSFPASVQIAGENETHAMLIPGGAFPRFAVDLVSPKGLRRRIAIDPITSAPQVTVPAEAQ